MVHPSGAHAGCTQRRRSTRPSPPPPFPLPDASASHSLVLSNARSRVAWGVVMVKLPPPPLKSSPVAFLDRSTVLLAQQEDLPPPPLGGLLSWREGRCMGGAPRGPTVEALTAGARREGTELEIRPPARRQPVQLNDWLDKPGHSRIADGSSKRFIQWITPWITCGPRKSSKERSWQVVPRVLDYCPQQPMNTQSR